MAPDDVSGLHGCPPTMTENVPFHKGASVAKEAESSQSPVHPNKEVNGNQTEEPLIIMAENVEDLCQESVAAAIITEMFSIKDLIEKVDKRSCDHSFNALDILHFNKMTKLLTVENTIDSADPTVHSNNETLQRHLAKFNLQLDKVTLDGDCAFRSIVKQITKRTQNVQDRLSTHLKSLGLLINEEGDTFRLRQLFMEAVLSNAHGISSFIQGTEEDVLMKAREFCTMGTFDREIGDVVLRACCNILQIPILVITSNHTIPYLSF